MTTRLVLLAVCAFLASVNAAPSAKPVLVELYYESYCPDCQLFMLGQLEKAWTKIGLTGNHIP